ncbi:hypothetical protein TPHA_0B04830 [Tetrapisispora phaffii CBS 4417]|uniref:HTH La-type RNA-binding domain-containing protein n=1 Tax=Tetrapisispora phaffii (strain ATCC 24235 / CBS 4417 / NBRC 1672 / NRRL Y-8282 / UCD 70-5) TaxID=1071381 RepID=G8BQ71_TETPH|nr:hypothetical protein TPHA_0B04830 [Tetrapisispora phaffii CBS 4417]CCE62152.1 hypothetical protein TPHA_0B04830 [Tetrapisispora phaffii CBS 4417]
MSTDIAVAKPVEEVKKPEPVLTPAPVPKSSPWNVVSNSIPVTTIDISSLNKDNAKNTSMPTIKTSSNTKWTPIKASIVVAGSKKSSGNNGNNNVVRRNGKNGKSNNGNRNKTKKPVKPTSQQNENKKNDFNENNSKFNENQDQNDGKQDMGNGFPKKRPFNGQRQSRTGFRPQNKQMHQSEYSLQPIIMAVNNVARQIEYYFSEENLAKDTFLKEKLSKDGYAPLSVIAKFYRIVNLSFNGDANIIMAALREITFNQNAAVEIAFGELQSSAFGEQNVTEQSPELNASILDNYFVRSKNWEASAPSESTTVVSIQKTFVGNDLDQFMIQFNPEPVPVKNEDETPAEVTEPVESN